MELGSATKLFHLKINPRKYSYWMQGMRVSLAISRLHNALMLNANTVSNHFRFAPVPFNPQFVALRPRITTLHSTRYYSTITNPLMIAFLGTVDVAFNRLNYCSGITQFFVNNNQQRPYEKSPSNASQASKSLQGYSAQSAAFQAPPWFVNRIVRADDNPRNNSNYPGKQWPFKVLPYSDIKYHFRIIMKASFKFRYTIITKYKPEYELYGRKYLWIRFDLQRYPNPYNGENVKWMYLFVAAIIFIHLFAFNFFHHRTARQLAFFCKMSNWKVK